MRRHGLRLASVSVISLALTTALLLALAPPVRAWSPPDKATTPIIFVHGYNDGLGCPSVDENMWSVLKADLREDGWLGPQRAVGFYSCDKHVSTSPNDWIDLHGDHNTYYSKSPCSPVAPTNENGTSGPGSHNPNTTLRPLPNNRAWFTLSTLSK